MAVTISSFKHTITPNLMTLKPSTYYSPSSLRLCFGFQLRVGGGGTRSVTRIAVARQGGRHYQRPSGPRRRQGDAAFVNPDYDPALDLYRIRQYCPRMQILLFSDSLIAWITKHKFEQQKKKRVQQKRSAANRMDIKEIKIGYNIDSHDYSVRLRAAKRFLNDGGKGHGASETSRK